MPEAPEINVLVTQLKQILKLPVFRDNKSIYIISDNSTIIIHLMLKGFLSLDKTNYSIANIQLNGITIFVNDSMKLATVTIVKQQLTPDKRPTFLSFCQNHPNMMIKNALMKYKMGIGKYLLKIIMKEFNCDVKCKEMSNEMINKVKLYADDVIKKITSLGGKNTFRDIYGTYGKYC